jgi:hypothetical protein
MSNNVGNPVLAAYRVPPHSARRFHQICLGAVAEVIGPTGITPSEYAVWCRLLTYPDFINIDLRHASALIR